MTQSWPWGSQIVVLKTKVTCMVLRFTWRRDLVLHVIWIILTYVINFLHFFQCLMSFFSMAHRSLSSLCNFLCSFIKHREGFLDQSLFNIFVFGDMGGPSERWSTYYSGTDTSGELYNFSILSDLTKIINYPTCITNGEAHSPAF